MPPTGALISSKDKMRHHGCLCYFIPELEGLDGSGSQSLSSSLMGVLEGKIYSFVQVELEARGRGLRGRKPRQLCNSMWVPQPVLSLLPRPCHVSWGRATLWPRPTSWELRKQQNTGSVNTLPVISGIPACRAVVLNHTYLSTRTCQNALGSFSNQKNRYQKILSQLCAWEVQCSCLGRGSYLYNTAVSTASRALGRKTIFSPLRAFDSSHSLITSVQSVLLGPAFVPGGWSKCTVKEW